MYFQNKELLKPWHYFIVVFFLQRVYNIGYIYKWFMQNFYANTQPVHATHSHTSPVNNCKGSIKLKISRYTREQ